MIRVEIDTKNAAFGDYPGYEVARILGELVKRFTDYPDQPLSGSCKLRDINGNTVGEMEVVE